MAMSRRCFMRSVGFASTLWQQASVAAAESAGARLRRLAAQAALGNPVDNAIRPSAAITASGHHDSSLTPRQTLVTLGAPSHAPNPLLRWRGGVPSRKFTGDTDAWMGTPVVDLSPARNANWSSAGSAGYRSALNAAYSSVEIRHEGRYFETEWLANPIQGGVRYIVDGHYHAATGEGVHDNTDNVHHLDFGSRGRRRIMIEWSPAGALRSVSCEATGHLAAADRQDDFTVALVGDSVSAGLTPSTLGEPDAWPVRLMHLLGWPDLAQIAIGGTGYIESGRSSPYRGHMMADMAAVDAYRPIGAIVFWGSTNDKGRSAAAVQAAVRATLLTARASYPGAPIFVLGSTDGSNNLSPALLAVEAGIAAAVAAMADPMTIFIPVSTAPRPWISGTGKSGAPTGDGNADVAIGPDGIHPTALGHRIIADRAASDIRDVLRKRALI